MVGLLLQALEGMGYPGAAAALEREVEAAEEGVDGVGADAAGVVAERRRLRGALVELREVGKLVDWRSVFLAAWWPNL